MLSPSPSSSFSNPAVREVGIGDAEAEGEQSGIEGGVARAEQGEGGAGAIGADGPDVRAVVRACVRSGVAGRPGARSVRACGIENAKGNMGESVDPETTPGLGVPGEMAATRAAAASESAAESGQPPENMPMDFRSTTVIKGSIRRRARSASNFASLPSNEILTDESGIVLSVTPAFLTFTGYEEKEMVGRKCNFLQGEQTDPNDVEELRSAMKDTSQTSVVILNYRKDGQPFWNILTIKPEFDNNKKALSVYHGEVIGIPIPPHMQSYPRLCLDDALALISVYSSIPRGPALLDNVYIGYGSAKGLVTVDALKDKAPNDANEGEADIEGEPTQRGGDSEQTDGKSLYRHQNYATRFLDSDAAEKPAEETRYQFVAETTLPTHNGRYRVRAYRNPETGAEPLAIIHGNVEGQSNVVVRVHDQCLTSEIFGSLKCDCKQQLDFALNFIKGESAVPDHGLKQEPHPEDVNKATPAPAGGIVLYLPQEGRGIGLANKIAAYAMQETGLDTVDANRHLGLPDDAREYDSVRDILRDLKIDSVRLLTNNPRKIECLEALGITITERLECIVVPNSDYSMNYVQAKARRMGHFVDINSLSSNFSKQQR
ncbi:Riboflavin biosynthesis protein RibBA [Hondaea fermentalgiana]|uniref:GTP cyclohydrolase II n=1 Tax=Hondaea fermentalgiana TaxID=2315210 RepID=A0A2R5GYC7_9STRA|nr:Riboflavin biosynthesis protein RibBA [Hondaea fermentalgiana]|eukprot:GBG32984.1 Riboflavin biosynthesis protein RibBA [Hondaea fermentalgiana]